MSTPDAQLVEHLLPILQRLAELDPRNCRSQEAIRGLEAALEHRFPAHGPKAQTLAAALRRGVAEGWLCDRGEPEARFSRVRKPSPETLGFSIDVVSLFGRALPHTHPLGEVTLGFLADPADPDERARFDGRPPGWVFLGPGSTHTPEVTGSRMLLVYFLPEGSVIWQQPG